MNFLSNLWNSIKGLGWDAGTQGENSQAQAAPVTAPQAPAPLPQPQAPSPLPAASSLVKAQPNQPTNIALPQAPAPVPEPGLLQKAANWLGNEAEFAVEHPVSSVENVASAVTNAPLVKGFAGDLAAPFVQNEVNAANEREQNQENQVNNAINAELKTAVTPLQKAKLTAILGTGGQQQDAASYDANVNDTPEQVFGNAGGVLLDTLLPSTLGGAAAPEASALVKAAEGAGLGAGYGAANAAGANATPAQLAEQTAIGAGTGGVLSTLGGALSKFIGGLRGAAPEAVSAVENAVAPEAEAATAAPATPIPGVSAPQDTTLTDLTGKVVNPQELDLTEPNTAFNPPIQQNPQPIGRDISAPLQKAPVALGQVPSEPAASPEATLPSTPPAQVPVTPEPQAQAVQAPENVALTPKPTEIPQETSVEPQKTVSQLQPPVAETSATAPVAGDLKAPRQADIFLSKENAADAAEMRAKLPKADTVNLEGVMNKARANVAQMGDAASIAKAYQAPVEIGNIEGYYTSLKAAQSLEGLTDAASKEARTNLAAAMLEYQSKAGLDLRASQVLFQDMTTEMKSASGLKWLIKQADKVGDTALVNKLTDPAEQNVISANLDKFFDKDKVLGDQVGAARGVLGDSANHTPEEIDAAGKALQDSTALQRQNAQELADYMKTNLPQTKGDWGDALSTFQRNSMLSAPSGALRHSSSNLINAGLEVAKSVPEAAYGKVGNFLSQTPGKYVDSALSPMDIVRSAPEALKKAVNTVKGISEPGYDSAEGAMKAAKTPSALGDVGNNAKGLWSRLTKARVELPADLTKGVQDGQITRLLRQQGQQQGLTGDGLDKFVQAGQYDPPRGILAKGEEVHDTLNNMNKNPLSDLLVKLKNDVSGSSPTGKAFSNAIEAFPRVTGGKIWNAVTDRNVIANTIKFAQNVTKDPSLAADQFGKAVTGVGVIGAGVLLSKEGVITDKDANGNSYDGYYLHLGNSYTPIGFLGALAPNIILGHLWNEATSGTQDAATVFENGAKAMANVLGTSDLTGEGSPAIKAGADLTSTTGGLPKATADLISGVGGQYIPSIGGDINSGLNQTSLDPTHEAADTTVAGGGFTPTGRPSTAKDAIGSAVASLENRLPIASQALPRASGEAAPSFVDRVTQGNHSSDQQIQDAATAATNAAANGDKNWTSFKQAGGFDTPGIRDILDPATQKIYDAAKAGTTLSDADSAKLVAAVSKGASVSGDSRFLSDGNYAANLAALKVAQAEAQQDPTTTQDTLDKYKAQIARGQVYQKYQVPYSLIDQYGKTSAAQWRAMGTPTNAAYNPVAYQSLYALDQELAASGGTRSADPNQPYLTAKAASTSSSTAAKGGKVGTPVNIGNGTLQKITGKSIGANPIPNVALVKSTALPQKRAISVKAGV